MSTYKHPFYVHPSRFWSVVIHEHIGGQRADGHSTSFLFCFVFPGRYALRNVCLLHCVPTLPSKQRQNSSNKPLALEKQPVSIFFLLLGSAWCEDAHKDRSIIENSDPEATCSLTNTRRAHGHVRTTNGSIGAGCFCSLAFCTSSTSTSEKAVCLTYLRLGSSGNRIICTSHSKGK